MNKFTAQNATVSAALQALLDEGFVDHVPSSKGKGKLSTDWTLNEMFLGRLLGIEDEDMTNKPGQKTVKKYVFQRHDLENPDVAMEEVAMYGSRNLKFSHEHIEKMVFIQCTDIDEKPQDLPAGEAYRRNPKFKIKVRK